MSNRTDLHTYASWIFNKNCILLETIYFCILYWPANPVKQATNSVNGVIMNEGLSAKGAEVQSREIGLTNSMGKSKALITIDLTGYYIMSRRKQTDDAVILIVEHPCYLMSAENC